MGSFDVNKPEVGEPQAAEETKTVPVNVTVLSFWLFDNYVFFDYRNYAGASVRTVQAGGHASPAPSPF